MIEKITSVDKVEVFENGCVQVREVTRILEDNVMISRSFQRHTIHPGDDFSKESVMVISICNAVHAPDVITAFQIILE